MHSFFRRAALTGAVLGTFAVSVHAQAVSVRPGAPGEPSRIITHDHTATPQTPYVEADVQFMQGMIHHHGQALEMTRLARTRTTNHALLTLAERIDVSQGDEIRWMQRWLRERGHEAPDLMMPHDMHGMERGAGEDAEHADHRDTGTPTHHGETGPEQEYANGPDKDHHEAPEHTGHAMTHDALMPGMLTAEEMQQLADATEKDFDRLFLKYMIRHHEGGLLMVADLLAQDGGGQAPEVYRFATDIDADQRADIRRMLDMLDVPRLPTILRHR